MTTTDWASLARDLQSLLHLEAAPIAISWHDSAPEGVDAFGGERPEPTPDGRTGAVAASCVFWMHAPERTFSTVEADHGNCSVGLMTHGWKTIDEVAGNSDVAALLDSGWVTMDVVPKIPTVSERPGAMVYGPLADTPVDPDVVFIRLNAKQMMVLSDAWPGLRVEGKPQCHILAIAKDEGEPAASVGCVLSRVRTGMRAEEMTCAIPASRLAEVVNRLRPTNDADSAVARYAAEDAARF
ncbi:MAG TPA: DUF169 domain-containing protein [Acidimicrobiia bacterium]|nr:DUF169 domain-containing protein [Acidimicrobiia bacterium]